jgi:hypothetical protein
MQFKECVKYNINAHNYETGSNQTEPEGIMLINIIVCYCLLMHVSIYLHKKHYENRSIYL